MKILQKKRAAVNDGDWRELEVTSIVQPVITTEHSL